MLLDAVGISIVGKPVDAVPAEFQRAGFFLTHVLECPMEGAGNLPAELQGALQARLPAVATRVRRSLKPKRVMAVTEALASVMEDIRKLELGCPVLLDRGRPFRLTTAAGGKEVERIREALAGGAKD
jgi:hypothetical protein